MAYTPKTWVCGETITADGLNNIEDGIQEALECCEGGGDCGYSCETTSTVLTEETVTTSGSAPYIAADLSYSTPIDADSLTATFEGADYELDKVDLGWGIAYGDWQNAPDFTNYPLAILSSNGANTIFTETAGTYSVKLVANQEDISTSECFEKAVKLFGLKYVADAEIEGGVLANNVNANTVTAQYALAEGSSTTASGMASHAEGQGTTASGNYSHAQNEGTIAQGKDQTAIGKHNIPQGTADSSANTDYAFIIGNGASSNNRSNALAVKWDGTFVFANGTEISPAQFASLLALL